VELFTWESAATEFQMCLPNARVQDVDIDTFARELRMKPSIVQAP